MLVCLAAIAALPATASAVLSGVNGRIVFVSGRGQASDSTAKLYLRPAIGSSGAGSPSLVTTATGAGMHRHPTWSPDRRMVAYAEGDDATDNFDIFILDLTDPGATPQNITQSNDVTDDRPAWSPDGTRIAFDSENVDGSNQLNIKIYNVGTGNITNFTSIAGGTYEHKPAWTPDSQTLFYGTGSFAAAGSLDLVRRPADGSAGPTDVAAAPGISEFQPAVSPDGTRICFTRGDLGSPNARVVVSLANGGGQTVLPGNQAAGMAGYNCTWSPDGTKIAYVIGTFSNGDLFIESSDLTGSVFLPLESTLNRFDGNPDWAPDGRPRCVNRTAFTRPNTPVTILVRCPDTGPAYERTEVLADVPPDGRPSNGTVAPTDAQPSPARITYTPDPGFRGPDTFEVRSRDQVAFGGRGTIRVNVGPRCAGRALTKVGTPGRDKLRGRPRRRDVIAGLGGADVIRGLGRGDILCGNRGRDRLIGGRGRDKLFGGPGRDFLKGGPGKDKLRGGPGRDKQVQ